MVMWWARTTRQQLSRRLSEHWLGTTSAFWWAFARGVRSRPLGRKRKREEEEENSTVLTWNVRSHSWRPVGGWIEVMRRLCCPWQLAVLMWPNVVGVAGHGTIPVGLQFTGKEKPLKTNNNMRQRAYWRHYREDVEALLLTISIKKKTETLREHYRH